MTYFLWNSLLANWHWSLSLYFTPTPPLRDRWWCCLCWHVLAVSISVFKCSIGSHINNLLYTLMYIYIYIHTVYCFQKKTCFIICICVFIHKCTTCFGKELGIGPRFRLWGPIHHKPKPRIFTCIPTLRRIQATNAFSIPQSHLGNFRVPKQSFRNSWCTEYSRIAVHCRSVGSPIWWWDPLALA